MMRLDISHVVNYFHCDLKCSYCVTDWNNQRQTRTQVPRDVSEAQERRLLGAMAALPYRVHLTLSNAGEPFINGWLLDAIAEICLPVSRSVGVEALTLVTNLHSDWDRVIAPFLDRVDVRRLALACSFHESVLSKREVDSFFATCQKAREHGAFVMVVSVVRPGHLDRAFACKQRCELLGLPYLPNAMVASEGGRGFQLERSPYSSEEIALARDLTETPHAHKVLFERRTTRGVRCQAGRRYAYVDSAGDVFPCVSLKNSAKDSTDHLGNLLDGSFALHDEPRSCPLTSCGCATDASAIDLVDGRYVRTIDHRYLRMRDDVDARALAMGYGPSVWAVAAGVQRLRSQSLQERTVP